MKIFISHSSQDKELIFMLVDLLVKGFYIDLSDIFCTSLDNSLVVGEDFIKLIKDNLHDSEIVLFIITQNYISSKFCIMEMGAAWAYKDNIVPIIVPPLDFNVLNETPMKTIQGLMLDDAHSIFNKFYSKKLVDNNIISRLSFMKEHELFNNIEDFVHKVKKYININYGFNFTDAKVIAVAQNGDPDAAKIESNVDIQKLYCNFKPNEYYPIPSNFISCVFQFVPHKDWSTITENSYISFECRSQNCSISKLIVEFKCGDNLFKFFESPFVITNEYTKINIPISYSNMSKKYLKDISEICFVIRPNFVKNFVGQLEIKDLKFQDIDITNN